MDDFVQKEPAKMSYQEMRADLNVLIVRVSRLERELHDAANSRIDATMRAVDTLEERLSDLEDAQPDPATEIPAPKAGKGLLVVVTDLQRDVEVWQSPGSTRRIRSQDGFATFLLPKGDYEVLISDPVVFRRPPTKISTSVLDGTATVVYEKSCQDP